MFFTHGLPKGPELDGGTTRFEPIVRLEAILDRAERPHRGNRFDMAAKGADGLPLGEVEA